MNARRIALALGLTLGFAAPGTAVAADRDHDRLPDAWEKRHGLNFKKASDAGRDSDKDGLSSWGEFRAGTDPRRKDSDRDGRKDGREDSDRDKLVNADEEPTGHDPGDRDSDGDGIRDGAEGAGWVTAYDGETITIRYAAGGSVTALVELGDEGEDEIEEDFDGDDAFDGEDLEAAAATDEDELAEEDEPSTDDELDIEVGDAVHESTVEEQDGDSFVTLLELVED